MSLSEFLAIFVPVSLALAGAGGAMFALLLKRDDLTNARIDRVNERMDRERDMQTTIRHDFRDEMHRLVHDEVTETEDRLRREFGMRSRSR